jgi:hypothetical protein
MHCSIVFVICSRDNLDHFDLDAPASGRLTWTTFVIICLGGSNCNFTSFLEVLHFSSTHGERIRCDHPRHKSLTIHRCSVSQSVTFLSKTPQYISMKINTLPQCTLQSRLQSCPSRHKCVLRILQRQSHPRRALSMGG